MQKNEEHVLHFIVTRFLEHIVFFSFRETERERKKRSDIIVFVFYTITILSGKQQVDVLDNAASEICNNKWKYSIYKLCLRKMENTNKNKNSQEKNTANVFFLLQMTYIQNIVFSDGYICTHCMLMRDCHGYRHFKCLKMCLYSCLLLSSILKL